MDKSLKKPSTIIAHKNTIKYINDLTINENDMAETDEINEVDLMNNIRNRSKEKNIFNAVGSTIIVVNPYEKLNTTNEEVLENFVKVKL